MDHDMGRGWPRVDVLNFLEPVWNPGLASLELRHYHWQAERPMTKKSI